MKTFRLSLFLLTISFANSGELSEFEKNVDHFLIPAAITYFTSDLLNVTNVIRTGYTTNAVIGYTLGCFTALSKEVFDDNFDKGEFNKWDVILGLGGSTLAALIYYPTHWYIYVEDVEVSDDEFELKLGIHF